MPEYGADKEADVDVKNSQPFYKNRINAENSGFVEVGTIEFCQKISDHTEKICKELRSEGEFLHRRDHRFLGPPGRN